MGHSPFRLHYKMFFLLDNLAQDKQHNLFTFFFSKYFGQDFFLLTTIFIYFILWMYLDVTFLSPNRKV